jgi:hypothetical protein
MCKFTTTTASKNHQAEQNLNQFAFHVVLNGAEYQKVQVFQL